MQTIFRSIFLAKFDWPLLAGTFQFSKDTIVSQQIYEFVLLWDGIQIVYLYLRRAYRKTHRMVASCLFSQQREVAMATAPGSNRWLVSQEPWRFHSRRPHRTCVPQYCTDGVDRVFADDSSTVCSSHSICSTWLSEIISNSDENLRKSASYCT